MCQEVLSILTGRRLGAVIPVRDNMISKYGGNTLRKICLFALILVSAHSFIFAGPNNNHDFSIGVSTGLLHGDTEEIVYIDGSSKKRLSQLDWDIKPLFYAGLDLKYSWLRSETKFGFFTDAGAKIGIPGKTGVMQDRDWAEDLGEEYLVSTYPHWLNYYSEHENKTRIAVLADLDAGMIYRLKNDFRLKFFLSYSLMYYSWEAWGGSYLYPTEYTAPDPSHGYWPSSEKVITYRQFWHIFSPGASFYGVFNRYFDMELSFKITPLIWLFAKDNHLMNDDLFFDTPKFGIFLEPGFVFNFRANKLVTVSFSYSYRFIAGSRGNSTLNSTKTYYNTSGAAYSAQDIGLFVSFNLF